MAAHAQVGQILTLAKGLAKHSWEYGVVAEALLEWYNPELSVFGVDPLSELKRASSNIEGVAALEYAKRYIKLDQATLIDGEGSAGDPASLGVYAVMLGSARDEYAAAAERQAHHLLHTVPRYANGAISHRENYAELWADFAYMAPPFLAYLGSFKDDTSRAVNAARQLCLYDEVLRESPGSTEHVSLWKHIVGSEQPDPGHWATGIGWGLAGMARVLAVLQAPRYAEETKVEQNALTDVMNRLIAGCIGADTSDNHDGLLLNYLNQEQFFPDAAGTALIASGVFRLATLQPKKVGPASVSWALDKRSAVMKHVDSGSGLVLPVPNPQNPKDVMPAASGSTEGQCFVALLCAAFRDWTMTSTLT